MPIKIGTRTFRSFQEAVRFVAKTRPDVKEPTKYVGAVEATINNRRAAKKKRIGK